MKKIILFLSISILTITAYCQDVKIKNDHVYIDEKECLIIKGSGNNISITDLEGNEIIFLKFIHNSKYGSVYNKITFLDQKLSFTSQSYIFNKKILIKKLVEDGTLVNCKLDPQKVERFVMKYDENVEK